MATTNYGAPAVFHRKILPMIPSIAFQVFLLQISRESVAQNPVVSAIGHIYGASHISHPTWVTELEWPTAFATKRGYNLAGNVGISRRIDPFISSLGKLIELIGSTIYHENITCGIRRNANIQRLNESVGFIQKTISFSWIL